MRTNSLQLIATALATFLIASIPTASSHFAPPTNMKRVNSLRERDASTLMSGGDNNEGEVSTMDVPVKLLRISY